MNQPFKCLEALEKNLADVGELIAAHEALTGGGRGRPAQGMGKAVSRAAIVMLCASLEAFVEDQFEEGAAIFYDRSEAQLKPMFEQTSKKLNHPGKKEVTKLYSHIGILDLFALIRWRNMANKTVLARYEELVALRGRIAHGRKPNVSLATVRSLHQFVQQFAVVTERLVREHVHRHTQRALPKRRGRQTAAVGSKVAAA